MTALILTPPVLLVLAAWVVGVVLFIRPWARRAYDRASAETAAATFEAAFIPESHELADAERAIDGNLSAIREAREADVALRFAVADAEDALAEADRVIAEAGGLG